MAMTLEIIGFADCGEEDGDFSGALPESELRSDPWQCWVILCKAGNFNQACKAQALPPGLPLLLVFSSWQGWEVGSQQQPQGYSWLCAQKSLQPVLRELYVVLGIQTNHGYHSCLQDEGLTYYTISPALAHPTVLRGYSWLRAQEWLREILWGTYTVLRI